MSDPHARWTSPQMRQIWDTQTWAQTAMGIWAEVVIRQARRSDHIPPSTVAAYIEAAQKPITDDDLRMAQNCEHTTQHDVAAWLQVYNHRVRTTLGGEDPELAHRGMTGADIAENVAQAQVMRSLELIEQRSVAVLARLAEHIRSGRDSWIVGRTHNLPAQPITVGWRFAVCATEMLRYHWMLHDSLVAGLPTRGIRGAVGTYADMCAEFDESLIPSLTVAMGRLGLHVRGCFAQEAPRSWDLEVATLLLCLCSGVSSLSNTIRLMVGGGLASEQFDTGQIGSSAMPHKRNPRLSERIHALVSVMRGYVAMAAAETGDQWNEGDVSHSATRRVLLPGMFQTADAILGTAVRLLDGLLIDTGRRTEEMQRELPWISTGRILSAMTQVGVSRELAHRVISQAADKAVSAVAFVTLLGEDPRHPLTRAQIERLCNGGPVPLPGPAQQAMQMVLTEIEGLVGQNSVAAKWTPGQVV
jgi:adenylosuccinate lyase